jgi:hypothetical protein
MSILAAFLLGILSSIIGGAILIFVLGYWRNLIDFILFRSNFKTITGIDGVNKTIGEGISPEKALKLCKNNIRFLGIAANKLTRSDEFNEAIKRCNRPDEPIQFLLAHPDNPILQHAANRAGKPVAEYKEMVTKTLNRLNKLKNEHGYNIEVKLYKSYSEKGPPSFRLFFIDNKSVLVSYYVFGEGDGLQMPQIKISKPTNDRDTQNFYFAFNHYFNSLWELSENYPLSQD